MILLANYPENENERESNILSNRRGIILVTLHCFGLAKTNLLGYKLRNLAQAFVFIKLNTSI